MSRIFGHPPGLLNPHELVVLLDALAAARGAGLEVAGAERYREVRDERVHRLAASMRHHGAPVGGIGQLNGGYRLGERADLVQLNQHGIRDVLGDSASDARDVCDEEIIAHKFDRIAKLPVQQRPTGPVVFRQAVLENCDWVLAYPLGIERNHLFRAHGTALRPQLIEPVIEEAARGWIQSEDHVVAWPISGALDCAQYEFDGFDIMLEHRRESAFIPDSGRQSAVLQHFLQLVVDLRSPPQPLREIWRPNRRDHEFLKVRALPVRVGASVQDVEHRNRKSMGGRARYRNSGRPRDSAAARATARLTKNGIGTESALVRSPICGAHGSIYVSLIEGVEIPDRFGNGADDVADGLPHALTRISLQVAISELDGFMNARGCAGRYGCPTIRTARERDFNLYSRVASRVEELFPSVNCLNPSIHSIAPDIWRRRHDVRYTGDHVDSRLVGIIDPTDTRELHEGGVGLDARDVNEIASAGERTPKCL